MDIKQISVITVTDPDSQLPVDVVIYKMSNGAMVGLDASAVENEEDCFSPYDENRIPLIFEEDK